MIHHLDYDTLTAFVLATAALALSPGPDNMYVLTQSMVNGKKYGLATTAGLITGCLIHTSLLAFGISAMISRSERLFFIIKLFGACYLFFLAFRVGVSRPDSTMNANGKGLRKNPWQLFRQGFIMNVLNPKVTVFFLAFFPGFLFSRDVSPVLQFYALGLLFMTVSFIIFSAIALLSGAISGYLRSQPKMAHVLKWFQVGVFMAIGIYLLLSDK